MPLPPVLALESALLLAWYVIAFVFLFRLRRTEMPAAGGDALSWWRRALSALVLAGTAWWFIQVLRQGTVFPAYGVALVAALLCLLLLGNRDPALPAADLGTLPLWLLGFAALLVRVAALEAPPGIAEDEARKCLDCITDLNGISSVFRIGNLAHPDFPCLVLGPLFAFVGPGAVVTHLYTAVAGALSVVAFSVLASLLLSPSASLAATALLVASPHHLLYSRVLFGAETTLPQILFLAFAIHAARRLSCSSALMAGSALGVLLYQYVVVRVMPAGLLVIFVCAQIADWRRFGRRAGVLSALLLATVITLVPLLARVDGRTFLFSPMQSALFTFGGQTSAAEAWPRLVSLVRAHLLMFRTGGTLGAMATLAHSRVVMLPALLEMLLVFGFADSAVRLNRFAQPVMASLFIIGLLPSILSGVPHSHRTMLVIPAVYLLIGSALERLSVLLPRTRYAPLLAALLFVPVVVIGASQSLRFYFGPAWEDVNDRGEFGGNTAQLTKEATRLTAAGETFITGLPDVVRFLNADQLHTRVLRQFGYADWLPENWKCNFRGLLLDAHWADLGSPLQDVLSVSDAHVLIDPPARPVGAALALRASELKLPPRMLNGVERRCGTLMLASPKRVIAVREGEVRIDDISLGELPADQQPWFAAGLHRACVAGIVAADWVDRAGTKESIRLMPADLYRIPLHGWVHRVDCSETPGRVTYLGIEPFLFHSFDGVASQPLCDTASRHVISAVLAPRDTDTAFEVWPYSDAVAIEVGGRPVVVERHGELATFDIAASGDTVRVDVRVIGAARGSEGLQLALYALQGALKRVPPYEWFSPPEGETSVAPPVARWESPAG